MLDEAGAPKTIVTAFICYRHEFKKQAEEVRDVLQLAGCNVSLDDSFAKSNVRHTFQSAAFIESSNLVVIVLPPNFKEWLPDTLETLKDAAIRNQIPFLGREIVNVLEEMYDDRGKHVQILVLQESGSPSVEDLPDYFRTRPNVIECGREDWKAQIAGRIHVIRDELKQMRARPIPDDLRRIRDELFTRIQEWSYGRTGGRTQRADVELAYHPRFYIDLPGSLSVDSRESNPSMVSDVVSWVTSSRSPDGWLIGGIGSGKTIALTHAGAMAARRWNDWIARSRSGAAPNRKWAPRVPILMKCSTLFAFQPESAAPETTPALLFKNMARALSRTSSELEEFLGIWPCLVLLDALDEVPDPEADVRLDALLSMLRYFAKDMRVVITTRATDFRPSFEKSEVVTIQSLNTDRGAALVSRIAEARADIRPRLRQVKRIMDDADVVSQPQFLNSPQTLTLACLLASQAADLPVDMRLCELLERWLTASCEPDGVFAIDRSALKTIALRAMATGQQWVEVSNIRDVLDKVGLVVGSQRFVREFDRVTGIVHLGRMLNHDYVEFGHASLRDYLSAEAVAEWPEDTLFSRARQEFLAGWPRVVEFLPAALSKQNLPGAVEVLLRAMAEAADSGDSEGALIWLTGLRSIVNDAAVQVSSAARDFVRRAHASATRINCCWPVHTRAEILDACGVAGRTFLAELLPQPWVPIPELTTPARRLSIAAWPVTVEDYKGFLNSRDSLRDEFWSRPSCIQEFKEAAWFEQFRTPLRPVTSVTWFEAVAYCMWLTWRARQRKSQQVFRLPSPDEWRAIAQPVGAERVYPWESDYRGFNYRGTQLRRPSPVGLFPSYCRPGLFDFGTNVYEWSNKESDRNSEDAVVLGAYWGDFIDNLSIARPRITHPRAERRSDTGFRCIREERS